MECRNCNSSVRIKLNKKGTNLYECKSCGLVFYEPKDYNLSEIYSKEYFISTENISQGYNNYFSLEDSFRKTFEKRLNKISKIYKFKGNELLDLGCGPGFFLKTGKEQGWNVKGIEISDFAAKYANENYGLNVISGTLKEGIFAPDSFDLVTMWDVVEHLQNPLETLKIVNNILKSNGALVLTTGNIDSLFAKVCGSKWHLINIPEHIFYFNPKSITKILNKAGFEIITIKHESSYYTMHYLLERLEKTMLPKSVISVVKSIVSLDTVLPVNLFDIMTVYVIKSHNINID